MFTLSLYHLFIKCFENCLTHEFDICVWCVYCGWYTWLDGNVQRLVPFVLLFLFTVHFERLPLAFAPDMLWKKCMMNWKPDLLIVVWYSRIIYSNTYIPLIYIYIQWYVCDCNTCFNATMLRFVGENKLQILFSYHPSNDHENSYWLLYSFYSV